MAEAPDVIVVGAGVMGCGTAYWLSQAGCSVLVLERDGIASGASGMAAAMLESVGHGAHLSLNDPMAELAKASFEQHRVWSQQLPDVSGVKTGYRENPLVHPVFSPAELAALKPQALALQRHNPDAQWLEGAALWEVEPRLNCEALGGLVTPQAQVIASRYTLALARAAERGGATMRHGDVVGLERQAERVTGVRLRNGARLSAGVVVLAMGPWSQEAAQWIGLRVPVYPVRGQLLQLRVPDPQLRATISYDGMYVVRKADGVTLAGATEEHDSGFVCHPTLEGRQLVLEAALHLAPSLGDAEIVNQVAGLRPGSVDRLPLIGPVPGWQGLYMLAGHFRSGMLLSAMSTRIIAELILHGASPISIDAFRPERFGPLHDKA